MSLLDPFVKDFFAIIEKNLSSIGDDSITETDDVRVIQDRMLTEQEADGILLSSALFGTLFVCGFLSMIFMMVRRQIDDLFLRYALILMIIALFISSVMCFIMTSYNSSEWVKNCLNVQTVSF